MQLPFEILGAGYIQGMDDTPTPVEPSDSAPVVPSAGADAPLETAGTPVEGKPQSVVPIDPASLKAAHSSYGDYLQKAGLPFEDEEFSEGEYTARDVPDSQE